MFDTYEEKTLTLAEAQPILAKNPKALVKIDGDKYVVKVKVSKEELKRRKDEKKKQEDMDKLAKIAAQAKPKDAPPAVPIEGAQPANIQTLEEYTKITGRNKLPVELTRIAPNNKRITVMRGAVDLRVNRGADIAKILFLFTKKTGYYIDPKGILEVDVKKGRRNREGKAYKLVFDTLYAEHLKADGTMDYSDDLEMILADTGGLDQPVMIAAWEGRFEFTPTIRNAMIVIGFLGLLFGLALNGVAHFTPITQIHWVP